MPRLNLTLSNSVNARLERLQIACDSATKTEVVRRALTVFELLMTLPQDSKIEVTQSDGESFRIRLIP